MIKKSIIIISTIILLVGSLGWATMHVMSTNLFWLYIYKKDYGYHQLDGYDQLLQDVSTCLDPHINYDELKNHTVKQAGYKAEIIIDDHCDKIINEFISYNSADIFYIKRMIYTEVTLAYHPDYWFVDFFPSTLKKYFSNAL